VTASRDLARHEAAHAVVAHALGLTVTAVTIEREDGGLTTIEGWATLPLRQRVVVHLAGPLVDFGTSSGRCIDGTPDHAEVLAAPPEVIADARAEVLALLNHRPVMAAIELLASALVEHRTLRFAPREE
jgi:hypothetical protein